MTLITGKNYNVFGLVGDTTKIDERDVLANPWIDNVTRVSAPYKRANRLFHPADSVIDCGGVKIGGKEKIAVMAGPCSIEGAEQALRIAQGVKAGGATLFRGGAYKPRTSPYSFQGLETEGILDMVKAREATGMPIVSELMSEDRIPEFEEYVDVVQIGARNMQNFQLLKAVGKMHKPVLLKRGLCNTIEEWIMSAEYIMAGGNEQVILCERGIRTFEKYTRNTLDLSAVPIIHEKTHLPIIVDPSHATGKANLVEPMMIAAVAAGADGLERGGPLRPAARMERRRTVPDPGFLRTGHGKVPSGGMGHWPGYVTAYAGNDSERAFRGRHHHCPTQQEHGPPCCALRGTGRGPQPYHEPRIQQGHLCHAGRSGTAVRPCAHRRRRCCGGRAGAFCAPCRAGELLRERQHPALSHPHRQPDRTGSFLHRPRAADGAASVGV